MNKIGIITDSHSGITPQEAKELGITVLPMPFYCEDTCYYEGVSITRDEFFEKIREGKTVSTSQAVLGDIIETWERELEVYDELLYIPLSSGLSGSCSTAQALAQDEAFEGKVFVVDNGRISVPLYCSVLDALELIKEGYGAAQIQEILEGEKNNNVIYLAVETLDNLKRGGRITPGTAALGTVLNIKPVMKFSTGALDVYKKCRGMKKAKKEMLESMKQNLENDYKKYVERGDIYLMAATSADEETTQKWVEEIQAAFPEMEVISAPLTLGISCHVGEGALGIACACRPERPEKK